MWWKIGTIGFGAASLAAGYFALMFGAMFSQKETELSNVISIYDSAMHLATVTNESLNHQNKKLVDHILKENEAS